MWGQVPRTHAIRVLLTNLNGRLLCTSRVTAEHSFQTAETTIPFAKSRIGDFFQTRPVLGNQYLEDRTLQSYLKRHLPNSIFSKVEEDLTRFGQRISTEISGLGHQCEQEQPYVEHYDAWGNRVDRLVTCPAWKRLHDISAEEGIIAIAYEGENGEFSRLHQMAKVYLFAPVSGLYSCPIAMTDGAAKIIQTLRNLYPWLKERAFTHLTSRKPEMFWTSGQWMTERQGGSDVEREFYGGVSDGGSGEFGDDDGYDDRGMGHEHGDSGKPKLHGDWICEENGCGYHNFASRKSCKSCSAPRPVKSRGIGFGDDDHGTQKLHGNWICKENGCGYHNFASRKSCKSCSAPRPVKSRGIGFGDDDPGTEKLHGDWICKENGCEYHNFSFRNTCMFCGAPRPVESRGISVRPGDWRCEDPKCGYCNYAFRKECKLCSAPRPASLEYKVDVDIKTLHGGTPVTSVQPPEEIEVKRILNGDHGNHHSNGTETLAVPQSDGSYKLYGYKWFSSATDADMTFTLARVVDNQGHTIQGTRGLSLFYLEVRDQDGKLNNIQIEKLKNKLGTRQLPTAELLLHGTTAYKVSEEGRGVAGISNMLTLTRIHNAVAACGAMRRMCNLARDYSTRRRAFGNTLKNYPLHVQTLCRMEVETRVATLLTMEGARLLGKEDVGTASEDEQMLLRLLTPLTKLYTAKQAMNVVSEGLESFGGQGYIEDTGLPGTLRDAQVLPIWEGTTNILSLDVLRAIVKTQGAVLKVWHADILTRLAGSRDVADLQACTQQVEESSNGIMAFVSKNQDVLEIAARDFAYSLTKTYAGALLIEHAFEAGMNQTDVYTAQRWCNQDLSPVITNHSKQHYSMDSTELDLRLVFDGYHDQSQL